MAGNDLLGSGGVGVGFDRWVRVIRDVGFPAVVAFYLLWRLDGQVGELVTVVKETAVSMNEVVKMHGEDHRFRFGLREGREAEPN